MSGVSLSAIEAPSGPLSVLLLAVLQGLAEFLPISSSGHLALGRAVMGLKEAGLALDVALHVGTLGAVIAAYWTDVLRLFSDLFAGRLRMWGWLILATIPAGLVGVFLKDRIEEAANSPRVAGCGLLATTLLLLLGESRRPTTTQVPQGPAESDPWQSPSWFLALWMGSFQALAIVPGISRSGSTIAAAFLRGIPAGQAARLSFLMSLPAISGAAVLMLPDAFGAGFGEVSRAWVIVAAFLAGVVGWLALRTLILVLAKGALRWFALYTATLGIVALVWIA